MTERALTDDDGPQRSGTVVAIVIFLLMIAGVAYRYWPDEERDVRRHVVNLAETLSLEGAENAALSATRFAVLREYFAPDVRIRYDGKELQGRDSVLDAIRESNPPPGGILVEFLDVAIALSPDHRTADVTLRSHVSARNVPVAQSFIQSRTVRATMEQRDGDWVIASAEASVPIQTP